MDMFKDQILAEIERCRIICDEREDCEGCPCFTDASEMVIFAAPNACYLESLYQIKRGMGWNREIR